jgi:hypothetical protein
MALMTFSRNAGFTYDGDYFTEADIENLFSRKRPPALKDSPVLSAPAGIAFSDKPTVGEVRNAIGFVKQQVANGTFEPDLFAGVDLEALAADAETRLTGTVVQGQIPEDVLESLQASLQRVAVIEVGDELRLAVDGEALLIARGDIRAAAYPVFELVMVILDIIFVLWALVGVVCATNAKVKKAVAEIVKKAQEGFIGLANKWIAPIKEHFASFKLANTGSELWIAIKSVIKEVGTAFFNAIKFIWNNLWVPCKAIFKALIGSFWGVASAVFCLGTFIIGLIGTAGAILVASLMNLAGAICSLIGDTIKFIDKLHLAGTGPEVPLSADPDSA